MCPLNSIMYKQFAFQPAEFSSYLRARMSERMEDLNDHWNRARNSVEHDSKSSNFNVVQTFITQVSDVYFDFYPEPFVLPKEDSEKYLQMRLRQIPINMFEYIFQQANFEDRPLMWHTYLYLTDTRHARVRNYFRKDEYDVPVEDNVAKNEIKKDHQKWLYADKSLMRNRGKKEADSKWENYLPKDAKVSLNQKESPAKESIKESTRRLNEIRANLYEEMAFAHWVDKRIEYIKTDKYFKTDKYWVARKFNKHLYRGTDFVQEAVQKYNDFDKNVLKEDVLQVAKMSKGDRTLFYEFVRDHRQTERLEKQRIEHKILPPVETDPSSFKKESKQHFPGTFLYNAVRGKFNYSFDDAFQGKSGIYADMKKTDDVMWTFLNINNQPNSKIFSKKTIGKYQAAVDKAWSSKKSTVEVERWTIKNKGYATFPLAATLNNLSTLDIQNGDKDDFEYRAQFKRFLYLNNTFAYNTFYYIEKSSILLKVIMGYILGLPGDTLKLITECDARIEYQDLIVERTSTKSALTNSDEEKQEEKQEAQALADKIKEMTKETNMVCETKCTEKKKQQIKFKKISNTLWKCEDPKWPLQYLGAIDFHKLESIYEFEAKEDNFYDLYGTMFNEYFHIDRKLRRIVKGVTQETPDSIPLIKYLVTLIDKVKHNERGEKNDEWRDEMKEKLGDKKLGDKTSTKLANVWSVFSSFMKKKGNFKLDAELEVLFRKILHILFENNIEKAKEIIKNLIYKKFNYP